MAAKAKANPEKAGNFFAVVGSDEGLVREKALLLYNQLTGGVDDGFTHETIDGIADNSESAFEICSTTVQALLKLNECSAGVAWDKDPNCTLHPSATGKPVVTAIHPGDHSFPKKAPEVIVKFFKEHQRR